MKKIIFIELQNGNQRNTYFLTQNVTVVFSPRAQLHKMLLVLLTALA